MEKERGCYWMSRQEEPQEHHIQLRDKGHSIRISSFLSCPSVACGWDEEPLRYFESHFKTPKRFIRPLILFTFSTHFRVLGYFFEDVVTVYRNPDPARPHFGKPVTKIFLSSQLASAFLTGFWNLLGSSVSKNARKRGATPPTETVFRCG